MDILLFLVFLTATLGAGATGAMFPPGDWYVKLNKPVWTPPNWMFPLVWTTLYALSALAATRVAGQPGSEWAMAFWAMQIAFNALWTPVFFGLRRLWGALPVMALLWVAVLGALISHWQIDFWAGLCFVPYLAWVTVAGALNLSVARLNPGVVPVDPARA